jgi:hypothetical protein
MGTRRKGERPVPKQVVEWTFSHPVAQAMRRGSKWFGAWIAEKTTPYQWLAKRTGLSIDRIREIDQGAGITRAELEALAEAWWITPAGLLASMPDPTIVAD